MAIYLFYTRATSDALSATLRSVMIYTDISFKDENRIAVGTIDLHYRNVDAALCIGSPGEIESIKTSK